MSQSTERVDSCSHLQALDRSVVIVTHGCGDEVVDVRSSVTGTGAKFRVEEWELKLKCGERGSIERREEFTATIE